MRFPFLLATALGCTVAGRAAEPPALLNLAAPPEREGISVLIENDTLFRTDRYYTNGFSLAWSRSEPATPLLRSLAARFGYDRERLRETHGLELGQIMSTPADTQNPAPQPTDRSWTGLLFLGATLQLESGAHFGVFKVFLGVTGPWSLADRTQAQWHRIIGVKTPKGWANQLPTEPEGGMIFERRHRFDLLDPAGQWNLELIPTLGGQLSTVLVKADAGAQLRAGFRVPRDFGTSLISTSGNLPPPRPSEIPHAARTGLGFNVFTAVVGSGVARNLFLDGGTFHDSPHVDRKPFVYSLAAGWALTHDRFRVTMTFVRESKAFTTQLAAFKYSSLNLAYFW
jgi:lipid A 3-O-deacylase